MKRFSYILTIGLCACFLLSTAYLYVKAVPHHRLSADLPILKTSFDFPLVPTDINTINDFFPFNQDDVCRKPVKNKLNQQMSGYQFKKFITNKRESIHGAFIQIDGNNVYKKGNSTLLIPKSFIIPTQSIFYPRKPRITFPEN